MIKPFRYQIEVFKALSAFLILALAILFIQPKATAQSYPWPVNFQYTNGLMPTNAKAEDAWNAYQYWKTNFVTSGCGESRVIFDYYEGTSRGATDKSMTVSEGIGYGMLLTAYAGDRGLFDDFWAYYKMFRNGNGVMNWKIQNCAPTSNGYNGASDAELDVAMALIVASHQWQSDAYLNDAKNMIRIIREKEFEGTILKPGDQFGGSNLVCPSYFSPAYYRVFKQYDGNEAFWDAAAAKGYEIIAAAGGQHGLVPDWCTASGGVASAADGYEDGGKNFIYDAIRTPWRSATDYLWHGNASAQAYCQKITNWCKTAHNNSPGQIGGKYGTALNNNDGQKLNSYHNNTFVGCFGAAAMATNDSQSWLDACYNDNVYTSPGYGEYFNASFKALSLFLMTGNFYLPPPDACEAPELGADKSLCSASTITLDATITNRTYQWKRNGTVISNQTARTLSVTQPGVYEVVATTTDGKNCVRRDKVEVYSSEIVLSFVETKGPGNVTITNTSTGGISDYTWTINGGNYVNEVFSTTRDAFLDQIPAGSYEITLTATNSGFTGCSQTKTLTKTVTIGDGVGVAMDDFNNLYSEGIVVWDLATSAYFEPIPKIQCSKESYETDPTLKECFNLPCSRLRVTGTGDGSLDATYHPFGIGFIEPAGPLDLTNVPFVSLKIKSTTDLELGIKLSMGTWSCNSQYIILEAGKDSVYNLDFTNVLDGWDTSINGPASITAYNAVDAIQFAAFEKDPLWSGTIDIDWLVIGAKSIPTPTFDSQKDDMGFNVYDANGLVSTWQPPFDACDGMATVKAQSCTSDEIKWYNGTTLLGTGDVIDLAPGQYIVHLINAGGVTADTFDVVGADLKAAFRYEIEDLGKGIRVINNSQDFDTFKWNYGTYVDTLDGSSTWETGYHYYRDEGTYNVCISVTNAACAQVDDSCQSVVIKCTAPLTPIGPFYASPGAIVNDTLTTCPGVPQTISVDSVDYAASYGWYGITGEIAGFTDSTITTAFAESQTLKLEAYNVCGEKVSDSIYINVPPAAVAEFTAEPLGGLQYAFIATWAGADAEYDWYVDGALVGSAIEYHHTFATDGEHQVKLVVTNSCGSDELTLPVGCSFPDVSAASITGSTSLCAGAGCTQYALTGVTGAASYTWEVPNGTVCTGTGTAVIEADLTSTGTLSVTVGNDCGAATPVMLDVTVNPAPVTSAITGNATPACGATGEVYSVTSTTGSTYEWTYPADAVVTGQGTASITVDFGTTNGIITVTETAAGCVGTPKELTVSLSGCSLSANFSASTTSACDGAEVTFTDLSTGTSANTNYTWSFGANATPSTATGVGPHVVTYSGTGTQDVSLTIEEGATDTEDKPAYINVITTPATPGAITGETAVCGTQTLPYSIAAVTGATSYTWTVPSGSSKTGTSNAIDVTFGSTSGDISVTATNSCGTSAASTLPVTVSNCSMVAAFSADVTTACEGDNVVFTDASVGATANTTYEWSFGTGANPATATGKGPHTVVYTGTGAKDVSLTITEGVATDAESKAAYVNVITTPATPGAMTGPAEICGGETATYSIAEVAGATSYVWTGPADATITGSGISVDVTFGTMAGEVTVAAVNACGTSAVSGTGVTVNDCNITAGFSADVTDPCIAETVTFTDASLGTTANATYSWNFGTDATPATATGVGPHQVSYSTKGAKTVSLTITEGNFNDTESKTSYINVLGIPNPPGGITGLSEICSGETSTYSVVAVSGATSYNWTVPAGATISGTTNSVDITFASTSGNISVNAVNKCGTSSEAAAPSKSVLVNNCGLAANFSADKVSTCTGATVVFTDASASTTASSTYAWNFGAGATPATATGKGPHSVVYSTAGSKDVSLEVTEAGASDAELKTAYISVTEGAGTAGTITGPTSVCAGETATFSISPVTGATAYSWTVPTGATKVENGTSVSVTFGTTSGNVVVTPSNSCGNGVSSQKSVTVNTSGTPSVSISASNNPAMEGETVTFTATPTNGGSTPTYEWFLNGTAVGTGSTFSSATLVSGDEVYVVMTSSSSCAAGTATSNVINMSVDTPPTGVAYAGTDKETCETTITLQGNTPICGNGTWTVVVGTGNFVNPNSGTTSVTGLSLGVNTFRWTHAGTGCETSTDDVNIKVISPSVSIAVDANPVCQGSSVTFTATPTNGGTTQSYQWLINGVAVSGVSTATFTSTSLSDADAVRCKMTSDVCGGVTISSTSIPMAVHAAPSIADAGVDQKIVTTTTSMEAVVPDFGTGLWTLISGPGTITNATIPTTSVSDLVVGSTSTFEWVVSSGVCPSTRDTVAIIVGEKPAASVVEGPVSVEPNSTATYSITGNTGSTYKWTVPAGANIIGSDSSNTVTISFGPSFSGSISVAETNDFGTTNSSISVNTNLGVGTVGAYATNLKLFPNPFQNEATFTIEAPVTTEVSIRVLDVKGLEVATYNGHFTNETITIGKEITSGVYTIQVLYDDRSEFLKLIKME